MPHATAPRTNEVDTDKRRQTIAGEERDPLHRSPLIFCARWKSRNLAPRRKSFTPTLMGVHRWAFTAGSVSEPPVGEHLLTQVCSEDLRLDRAPAGERGGLYGWWDVVPGALIH